MQEPLKVTLPPWRRGDNERCKVPGIYAIRGIDESWNHRDFISKKSSEIMARNFCYAGPLPIEFIETPPEPEPEPEPLVLPGHAVLVREGKYGNHHEVSMWLTVDSDCEVRLIVADKEVKTAIEKFNAAVRAMEGKNDESR